MKKRLLYVSILFISAVGLAACAQTRDDGAAVDEAAARPAADMNQLMRGIMFPNSNVIFAAQGDDPATIARDANPSASVNPLSGLYGGWQAVENSGLALADSAGLLLTPGRVCADGKPVPVQNADWRTFVQEMREAGLAAAAAARVQNQDQILDVTDRLTKACGNCHQVYRNTNRCTK